MAAVASQIESMLVASSSSSRPGSPAMEPSQQPAEFPLITTSIHEAKAFDEAAAFDEASASDGAAAGFEGAEEEEEPAETTGMPVRSVHDASLECAQAGGTIQVGDRVRMRGLKEGAPYHGDIFTVEEVDECGQAKVQLENSWTVMIIPVAYIEPADEADRERGDAPGDEVVYPTWLQDSEQDAGKDVVLDANGQQLHELDRVRIRGRSQYDGKDLVVESTNVGDGRVRLAFQLSQSAVSRMALLPKFLIKITTPQDGQGLAESEKLQHPASPTLTQDSGKCVDSDKQSAVLSRALANDDEIEPDRRSVASRASAANAQVEADKRSVASR